jgi:hypothetical protein
MRAENDIHILASSKQLRTNVDIRTNSTCNVKKVSPDVKRRGMAIINSESMEMGCHELSVFSHVLPEPWIVLLKEMSVMRTILNTYRALSIPQFHAITPNNDFSSKICFALWTSKVRERIICPDPAVVGDGKRTLEMFQSTFIVWKTREKGLDKRVTIISCWRNENKIPFTNLRLPQIQSHIFDPIEQILKNSLPISVEFLVEGQIEFIEDVREFVLSSAGVLLFVLSEHSIEVASGRRIIDSLLEPLAKHVVIPEQVSHDNPGLFFHRHILAIKVLSQSCDVGALLPDVDRILDVTGDVDNVEFPQSAAAKDVCFDALHELQEIVHRIDGRGISEVTEIGGEIEECGIKLIGSNEMGRVVEIVSSLRMVLQPIRVFGSVIPNDVRQRQESKLFLHSIGHLVDLLVLIVDARSGLEEIRGKGKLIVDAVGRVAVAAVIQGSKVNHVVALVFEDVEKLWPSFEGTEPFAGDGLDCQAGEGHVCPIKCQGRFNAEVMFFGGGLRELAFVCREEGIPS